jgi:hypothetical protein
MKRIIKQLRKAERVGKISLFSMASSLNVLSENETKSVLGGGDGTSSNPFTEEEFYAMLDAGTWTGGYVAGLGYAAPEVTVTGYYKYKFSDTDLNYDFVEQIGVHECTVSGSYSFSGSKIKMSASLSGTHVNGALSRSGRAKLYVNGTLVSTVSFQTSGSYISAPGKHPIGEAMFDLSGYTGTIRIEVEGSFTSYSNCYWGGTADCTIYTGER